MGTNVEEYRDLGTGTRLLALAAALLGASQVLDVDLKRSELKCLE